MIASSEPARPGRWLCACSALSWLWLAAACEMRPVTAEPSRRETNAKATALGIHHDASARSDTSRAHAACSDPRPEQPKTTTEPEAFLSAGFVFEPAAGAAAPAAKVQVTRVQKQRGDYRFVQLFPEGRARLMFFEVGVGRTARYSGEVEACWSYRSALGANDHAPSRRQIMIGLAGGHLQLMRTPTSLLEIAKDPSRAALYERVTAEIETTASCPVLGASERGRAQAVLDAGQSAAFLAAPAQALDALLFSADGSARVLNADTHDGKLIWKERHACWSLPSETHVVLALAGTQLELELSERGLRSVQVRSPPLTFVRAE